MDILSWFFSFLLVLSIDWSKKLDCQETQIKKGIIISFFYCFTTINNKRKRKIRFKYVNRLSRKGTAASTIEDIWTHWRTWKKAEITVKSWNKEGE